MRLRLGWRLFKRLLLAECRQAGRLSLEEVFLLICGKSSR